MDTEASSTQGDIISTVGWIALGIAAWLVVALAMGVLIGRMIRRRDRQVPHRAEPSAPPGVPSHTQDPDGSVDVPRVAGRGTPPRD